MWYAGEPSFAAVRGILEDRVIGRFPVFRRRPVEVDGQWMWEDDPDFDLKHHLRRVKLGGAGGVDELRDHVSKRFSAGFAPGRPLWDMEVIRGVTGLDDEPVTVTFSRFHHALADGIRLVQMMLSLCDSTGEDVLPPDVGRAGSGVWSPPAWALLVVAPPTRSTWRRASAWVRCGCRWPSPTCDPPRSSTGWT